MEAPAPGRLPDTLTTLFLAACDRHGRRVAFEDPQGAWTYRKARAAARAVAAAVARMPDERVGLLLPSCKEYGAAFFGIQLAGKTAVPLNPALTPPELRLLCTEAEIEHVITCRALAELVHALPVEGVAVEEATAGRRRGPRRTTPDSPEDVAAVLYTSGTAARPKGVMLTHRNFIANLEGCAEVLPLAPGEGVMVPLPLFHSFALTTGLLFPVAHGASALYPGPFRPQSVLRWLQDRRAAAMMAVPSVYGVLAAVPRPMDLDLSALRYCVAGGERVPEQVEHAFRAHFPVPLLQGYGITEAAPVLAVNPPEANRPGTVGPPLPNVEIRIADDAGRPLPAGAEGEIWARGENVMKGYLGQPDATAEALAPGGWLRTGDWGSLDADGYLTVTGRRKELIISRGENISPAEIEEALTAHPAVREAAALPLADARRGEVPQAFVVLNKGARVTADELRIFCRRRIAPHKVPRCIRFRRSLPHGPTGKVLRRKIT